MSRCSSLPGPDFHSAPRLLFLPDTGIDGDPSDRKVDAMKLLRRSVGNFAMFIVLCLATSASFAEPVALSLNSQIAAAPDVAINAKGELAVLWIDRSPQEQSSAGHSHNHDRHHAITDLYVSISRDGGKSFGAPGKVNSTSGIVWGQQTSRPRIVGTPNGTWHVAYTANESHPTLNKALLTTHYTRSVDGGQSFEAPRRLSAITDQDMSGVIHGGFASAAAFGTLAAAPDGRVYVYWIDTRHMEPDSNSGALYSASSSDNGDSFTADRQLIDTGVCPCCQLTAVANASSEIFLGSRGVDKDNIRAAMVVRMSRDNLPTSARQSIGGAPWQIAGCPLKPTVITTHDNKVFAAVHNGGEAKPGVIFSISNDAGKSFDAKGIIHPDAAVSDAPAIASNGSTVLLAWHAKVGSAPRRVFYRLYNLTGDPVGPITELDTAPGVSQHPAVTSRPDGDFQLVWQQDSKAWTREIAGR